MRNVQLMKKNKNILRVYHIRIIAKKKIGSNDMKQDRFLNNHCQECVRAYLSIHDCLSSRGRDQQSSDQNVSSRGHDRQSSE